MKNILKRLFSFLFVVFIFLSACSRGPQQIFPKHPLVTQKVTKVFHGDTAFTLEEREDIQRGVDIINFQANGLMSVTVIFDLNWDSGTIESLNVMEKTSDQIVKISKEAPLVVVMDTQSPKGSFAIGYCKVDFDRPWMKTKVYIIWDRIFGRDSFVQVVMHEILHAFRLHHVSDRSALMHWSTNQKAPTLCLNESDMKELCRIYNCNPSHLNMCE